MAEEVARQLGYAAYFVPAVRTPWRDLHVWNVHLDTRINNQDRLDQLKPVIDDAARHLGPRLIGGDFNTNDLYWLGNVLRPGA